MVWGSNAIAEAPWNSANRRVMPAANDPKFPAVYQHRHFQVHLTIQPSCFEVAHWIRFFLARGSGPEAEHTFHAVKIGNLFTQFGDISAFIGQYRNGA